MTGIDNLASQLQKTINEKDKKKIAGYDTQATVVKVDEDNIWVKIAGGIDETPVDKTVSCKEGDTVQVRVSGHRAWIAGNYTDPATGDSRVINLEKTVTEEFTVVKELVADKATIGQLRAAEAEIDDLTATKADISDLNAATARIGDLEADHVTINDFTAATGRISDLEADHVSTTDLQATNAEITTLKTTKADISDLSAATARIGALEADHVSTNDLQAANAEITSLKTTKADISDLNAATARIDDLEADHVTVNDFTAASGRIGALEADHVTVNDFTAATGRIGTLETDNTNIKGRLTAAEADIDDMEADTAKIHNLTADQLSATVGYIGDLTAANISASDISADHATVGSLDSNYAHITNGTIDNAKIGYADVNDLNTHYAGIDLANVNNAWIENGVVKDAAISDAQIIGVSANKLTAGTIDASNITVTNLNADNITTGTINGQRIGTGSLSLDKLSEDVYTEAEVNTIVDGLNDRIDGAIETFTGTVVPTLNNSPANTWTTTKLKDQHVGDVYYVVNSSSEQNGYCYRFTKSGSTYSWQLIKDSDVTAALARLETAEGKIGNIEAFDQEISTFKTTTEGQISTLQTKTTNLETSLGDKVSTATFNELSQTVDENSASITSLTTTVESKADSSTVTTLSNTVNSVSQTASSNSSKISNLTTVLGTNADGTTKTGDIVHRTSAVEQDLSGFKTTVSETYQTKSAMSNYSTTTQMNTAIQQSANAITASVEENYYTKSDTDDLLDDKADSSSVYTKSQIDVKVGEINTAVSAKADGAETTAALSLKANKATLTSEINASADTVKINADRVNIEGAAIFTSGRLSQTSLNNAYDAKGAADAAKAEAIAEIPTDVSELNNDAGYQNATQVSTAVTNGVSGKADKTAAVAEEQYIYISKASGTSSVSKNTTWVSRSDDVQNTWTTKRPTYNPSYPVLFIAKQKKVVSGTVTCTTPVKDDTTTVIDGGHITTGTIDASHVTVTNINASNITSGTLNADRIGAGSITISNVDSTIQNAVTTAQNTFIFDTSYQMNGTIASFEAHLYKGGIDVKEYVDGNNDPLYPPAMFTWYLKHEDSQTQEGDYIGSGYRINVNLSTCNYGAEVIAHFTTTEDSPLLNGDDDNLTDVNNNNLTGRTESGESVRVRDLTVVTTLAGTDKLMVIGSEDEHLVSVQTLQDYLNANLDKQVKFNTTAGWNAQTSLVSQVNTLYVYTDHQRDGQGNNVAGIKVGDGNAYVVDLPFTDAIATEHIADTTRHVTASERNFWNNKVRCYYASGDNLIFTTT